MGFGKRRNRSSSTEVKASKRKGVKKDDRLKACPHWRRSMRTLLRSYPDATGCVVASSEASLRKTFSPKLFHEKLSAETCELVNRPPMGVNLLCACLDAGIDVLKVLPETKEIGTDVLKKTLTDAKFQAAVANAQKGNEKSTAEVAAATKVILETFDGPSDGKDPLGRALVAVADASSRLWSMAVAALEVKALVGRQSFWAKSVPHIEQQPAGVQKFVRSPSLDVMSHATAAAYESGYYWGGKKNQRRKFGEASTSGSGSGKRAAPKAKKARSSSSSSSSTTAPKKVKKHAKDKKEKKAKKTKKSRSASDKGSPPKEKKQAAEPAVLQRLRAMDEGQELEVAGARYGNCCLALALGRAVVGPDADRAAVHSWASAWVTNLPEARKNRLQKNECTVGEAMYDDYVDFVTAVDPNAVVFVLTTGSPAMTKVWAGQNASLDNMIPYILKLADYHFTALFPPDGATLREILPDMPPLDIFSYVGPPGPGHLLVYRVECICKPPRGPCRCRLRSRARQGAKEAAVTCCGHSATR